MQQDPINKPLEAIEALFQRAEGSDDQDWGVGKYFATTLLAADGGGGQVGAAAAGAAAAPAAAAIPLLSKEALARGKIAHGTLVRWRCMVQDQFDQEFFVGVHEAADGKRVASKFCE